MKKLKLYGKLFIDIIRGNVVTNKEYGDSYNDISDTYERWINVMGKHATKIVNTDFFDENSKVIDLACGTGFITRELLRKGYRGEITGVDISRGMLEKCETIQYDRLKVYRRDAIEFLKDLTDRKEKVDGIFLGWAYPYLQQKKLMELTSMAVKKDGIFGLITNQKGTLEGVEKILLEVMAENINLVSKPMEAKIKLPSNENSINNNMKKYGFQKIFSKAEEEWRVFSSPEELYSWLMESGALAGVDNVFSHLNLVKKDIIGKIESRFKYMNGFRVNHKFIYGVYRKSGEYDYE